MTNKELKKLSRSELLEMLIAKSREAETLKIQLKEERKKLEDRRIIIHNAGSIAEASLQLNGVFEAAQKAVEQYTENMQRQADICAELEKESKKRAQKLLSDTEAKCADMEAQTQEKCEHMLKDAQQQAQTYWDEVSEKIVKLAEAQTGLKELLDSSGFGQK